MIQVESSHLQQLSVHVAACYPEEGCGLLIGRIESDRKVVEEVLPAQNVWTPDFLGLSELDPQFSNQKRSRLIRFAIAPHLMLQVQKDLRDRNLDLIGIFHSHPNGLAIPSEFDRAIAWPDYSYLIIALDSQQINAINSWRLDENQNFKREAMINLGHFFQS
jgi:proteasome lid subunit RPN8/RPN11